MKIIICDDEKAYVEDVKNNVDLFFKSRGIDAEFDTFTETSIIKNQANNFYDIAFLDVEIDDVLGTDIAYQLKNINPHIVIFIITSYEKYLDDAMDLNVFRFLKKPLDSRRLQSSLEKAIDFIDDMVVEFYLKENKECNEGLRKIKVVSNDIVYIEIVGHLTKVVTKNKTYLSENKMNYWKEKLSASFFYLVHNSFIINMKYITSYQRSLVVLENKYEVPIAYRKQAPFKSYFLKYYSGR